MFLEFPAGPVPNVSRTTFKWNSIPLSREPSRALLPRAEHNFIQNLEYNERIRAAIPRERNKLTHRAPRRARQEADMEDGRKWFRELRFGTSSGPCARLVRPSRISRRWRSFWLSPMSPMRPTSLPTATRPGGASSTQA